MTVAVNGDPDVVLVSRRVITMGPDGDDVHAIVVSGGAIQRTGGWDLAEQMRESGCRVVDVGDRPVLPGFVDTHVHYEIMSVALATSVSIHTPPCESIDDIVSTLRENLSMADARDGWLVGEGNLMQDQRLAERRLPTRHDLDKVSRDVPVALRIGGHTTAMNTRALELAGLSAGARLPRGALLERDDGGDLTGIAREVFYHLPIPVPHGDALRDALKQGMESGFTRHGVTTIGEIPRTVEAVEVMDGLIAAGELPCRIRTFLRVGPMGSMDEMTEMAHAPTSTGDPDRFRHQGIKLFADGGLSAATAATLRPYAIRPGSRGRLAYTSRRLRDLIEAIGEAGLQPMVHAVGERAQIAVCDAAAALSLDDGPRTRLRLEHAGNFVSGRQVLDAWSRGGVLPVPNIVMLYSFGAFMYRYLGEYDGAHGRFALQTMLREGWRLASGSDITGDEPQSTNPMFGIWTAVARRSVNGEVVDPEQALTVDQALRMYTIDAAAALGDDDVVGSIEAGKRADLVVLDRDPYAAPVDELRDIRCDMVFADGRLVYDRTGAGAVVGAGGRAR